MAGTVAGGAATAFGIAKTGPLRRGRIQMKQGVVTFLKQNGNKRVGRKVKVISVNTGGNPAGAKTTAQEVIERGGVLNDVP